LGKWKLRVLRGPETAREEFEDTADVFFAAVGTFNRWHWPDIPGLNDFKGRLVHSANWDVGEGLNDWSDKRIGVIGAVRLSSARPLVYRFVTPDRVARRYNWSLRYNLKLLIWTISSGVRPGCFLRFLVKFWRNSLMKMREIVCVSLLL